MEQWAAFPRVVLELYTNSLSLVQGTDQVMAAALYHHYHPRVEETEEERGEEVVEIEEEGEKSEGSEEEEDGVHMDIERLELVEDVVVPVIQPTTASSNNQGVGDSDRTVTANKRKSTQKPASGKGKCKKSTKV